MAIVAAAVTTPAARRTITHTAIRFSREREREVSRVAPPPAAGVAPGPTDDLGVDAPSSGEGEPPVGADPAPLAHTPAATDPAWTVAGPAAGEQPPPPRSDFPAALAEEETELEPDRPYAPLIFVGGALLLAIVLLTAVASGVVAL